MQFKKITDPSLFIYKEEMKKDAKNICARLDYSKGVFESKLKKTRVNLELTPDKETSGFLEKNFKQKTSTLYIGINPEDGLDFINFIMIHELYHLLYSPTSPLAFTGYNLSDNSYSVNSIVRFNSTGEIGSQLNEQIANLHAYETVMHNKGIYAQLSPKFKEISDFMREPMEPIKRLINCFQIAPQSSYGLDNGHITKDGKFIPDNLFLYGITTGSSEIFVREYEAIMGPYSWGKLNKKIDKFYSKFDLDVGKSIINNLNQFERVFKKR